MMAFLANKSSHAFCSLCLKVNFIDVKLGTQLCDRGVEDFIDESVDVYVISFELHIGVTESPSGLY